MEDFRGPTPAALAGARILTTAQAEELWKTGAISVDVLRYVRRPANLSPGTIWREPEQMNVPGSVWHPTPDTVRSAQSVKAISAAALVALPTATNKCHLLSVRLLDVLECRQARTDNGQPKRRPVSERPRRLGSVRTPVGNARAGAGGE